MMDLIHELGFYAAKKNWPKGLEDMPDLLKRAAASISPPEGKAIEGTALAEDAQLIDDLVEYADWGAMTKSELTSLEWRRSVATAWQRLRAALERTASTDVEPYGWMVRRKGSAHKGTFFAQEPLFDPGKWDREDYDVMPVYDRPAALPPSPAIECSDLVERLLDIGAMSFDQHIARTAYDAAAALAAQGGDAPGWWLAPNDATEEMIAAGLQVDWSNENENAAAHNIWHAMRAAAPSHSASNKG